MDGSRESWAPRDLDPNPCELCNRCSAATPDDACGCPSSSKPRTPIGMAAVKANLSYCCACRRRLVEVGGRQSNVRAQELQQLQAVAVAQHLAVNPFAKEARKCKSNLRLCTYSFELLVHYLQVRTGVPYWLCTTSSYSTLLPAGSLSVRQHIHPGSRKGHHQATLGKASQPTRAWAGVAASAQMQQQ
jgi:hypothetical protein